MKTAIKHENNEFLGINLKHVMGIKVVVNRPGTPKLLAIAHENGHKTRKRRVLCHKSQTCIGCCGIPQNHYQKIALNLCIASSSSHIVCQKLFCKPLFVFQTPHLLLKRQ